MPVDFADDVDRTADSTNLYARFLATIAAREQLRSFDRGAVARVIEHASRLVDDASKLTVHARTIGDLLREADYFAGESGRDSVTRAGCSAWSTPWTG